MNSDISDRNTLISPYGGQLIDLLVTGDERDALAARAAELPRLQLTPRNVCDLELIATGAFSPLDRFMGQADYERTLEEMRLASNQLFPLPITLTIKRDAPVKLDDEVALADQFNNILAVLRVEEIFGWDQEREAVHAYGTKDVRHPLVADPTAHYCRIRFRASCASRESCACCNWRVTTTSNLCA